MNNILYLLFNPENDDDVSLRKLFKDQNVQTASGVYNLEKIKYTFPENFYQSQTQLIQFPREISLVDDKNDFWTKLTTIERQAFMNVFSFLSFLDSIQADNLVALNIVSEAYELKRALLVHAFVEGGIHTESYQYILKSLFGEDSDLINFVYYRFKTFEPLKKRNELIANIYQELYTQVQKGIPDKEKYYIALFKNLVQDYILEGVIFYMGFMLFHLFYYRKNVLSGTNKEITLIRRDEQLHIGLFKKLIKTFEQEYSKYYKEEVIYGIAEASALADIAFYQEAIGDNILGIDAKQIELYIKYLTNKRLEFLGLKPLFSGNIYNPFQEIENAIGYTHGEESQRKDNFFEASTTDYIHTSNYNWDKIYSIDLKDIDFSE